MRILYYLPDVDRSSSGVVSYIQQLTNALGNDLDLHLITCHTSDELEVANCQKHYLSVRYVPNFKTHREFLDILLSVDPDVFHTNSCWIPTSALTAIWAKKAGYKVVYTTHGMLEPWIMKRHYLTKKLPAMLLYQKKALQLSDMLHATSDIERSNLLNLGYNSHVGVIPNFVNTSEISVKSEWQIKKKILFLSRLHEKKGVHHLLEAVRDLHQELSQYTIDIVGDSDIEQPYLKAQLMALSESFGLTDIVKFHNGVYGDEKFNLFRNADLFVLPTYSENFGIVVAEALACGTPVITTKGTPWSELQTHNCGWWIEIGTKPLVEAILSFLNLSEGDLEQMGKNGRRLIEEKYSIEKVGEEFLKMYASI